MLVEYVTRSELYSDDISGFEERYFKIAYKRLIFKGLFICIILALIAAYALGKPSCDGIDYPSQTCITYNHDDSFDPSMIQRVGVFTNVFYYTYIIVLIAAQKGKKNHNAKKIKRL